MFFCAGRNRVVLIGSEGGGAGVRTLLSCISSNQYPPTATTLPQLIRVRRRLTLKSAKLKVSETSSQFESPLYYPNTSPSPKKIGRFGHFVCKPSKQDADRGQALSKHTPPSRVIVTCGQIVRNTCRKQLCESTCTTSTLFAIDSFR